MSVIGEEVKFVPFCATTAERFAFGTGIDARSCVRFCNSDVSVVFRFCVLRPLMMESRSDVLMFGSLYAKP